MASMTGWSPTRPYQITTYAVARSDSSATQSILSQGSDNDGQYIYYSHELFDSDKLRLDYCRPFVNAETEFSTPMSAAYNDRTLISGTQYSQGVGVSLFQDDSEAASLASNTTLCRNQLPTQIGRALASNQPADAAGTRFYSGNLAEIVIYNSAIGANERGILESYLALKYGITLRGDYTAPGGSVVWDSTANADYQKISPVLRKTIAAA